jgi:hypothetical protein
MTPACLFLPQNGPYGSGPVLETNLQCLGGYGPALSPGASTYATTYYCSYQSFDMATYAGATDRTLRVYPFQQDAACMTVTPGGISIETCHQPLDDFQRWNFVADGAGGFLIQSVANQTFMKAGGATAGIALVSTGATSWYPYQPPGEGLA